MIQYEPVDDAGHLVFVEKKELIGDKILQWLMSRPKKNPNEQGMGNLQSMAPGAYGSMSGTLSYASASGEGASVNVDSMGRAVGVG